MGAPRPPRGLWLCAAGVVLAAVAASCQAAIDLDDFSFPPNEAQAPILVQGGAGGAPNAPATPESLGGVDASTEPDPGLLAAAGLDAGADGGVACPVGEHTCDGVCHPDTSLASCGPSCSVCAAPAANGIATCNGTACGVRCDPGYHDCNGQCRANDSLNSCGERCEPCLHPDNGRATCVGGGCGTECNPEFHDCNGLCVSNADPATCGGLCEPCPAPTGGSARCASGVCVPECPAEQEVCGTACIPLGTPCDGACPEGTHVCGAFCSPNDSTNSCGPTGCEACSSPINSQPSCDGASCGISCNTSFHPCNGACASDYDVNSCGSSCAPCPSGPANSLPACTSTAAGIGCDFACVASYHRCGNTCASDSSLATCGSRCEPCPVPTNGGATCDGASCGILCNLDFKACCGECIASTATCSFRRCGVVVGPVREIDPFPFTPIELAPRALP